MFQRWNSGAVSFGIQESKTMFSRPKEVQYDANNDSKSHKWRCRGGAAYVVFLNLFFRPRVIKAK